MFVRERVRTELGRFGDQEIFMLSAVRASVGQLEYCHADL